MTKTVTAFPSSFHGSFCLEVRVAIADITISDLGPQGDGIHQGARGRVYVDRAIPGDRVRARIEKDEQGNARAEVLELIAPSPYRQLPPCPYYDRCGGCTLQHLQSETYREWKVDLVAEAFRRQGLRPRQWLESKFIGSHNRRRATFAVQKRRDKIVMGYYRRRSQEVTDIDACLIADPKLLALREFIRPFLAQALSDGKSADIFLQLVDDSADMVITGPVGRNGEPDGFVREATEGLLKSSGIARVSWRAHERNDPTLILGKGPVVATFGRLKVGLPPAAFLQPTREGEQALVRAMMSALPTRGKFADLFSGCGTFSGPMLERGPVDAYESVPSAVRALSKAAGAEQLRVFRRDLFRHPLRREEINRYDAVVFDPPRAGCAEQAMAMASAKTRVLIGVSCNPATLARDARMLCDGGYWLQSLQVVDQFVWSHHVEVVAVFTKQKRHRS